MIAAAPIIAFFDLWMVDALVAALTAVAVGMVARALPPEEAGHVSRLLRPLAIGLALPAIWMLAQIVPMPPASKLSHPIWASAQAALAMPLKGSISVDPGLSLLALARYLSLAVVLFVATAATIDRRRAEWTLHGLTCVTAVMAVLLILQSLTNLPLAESSASRARIFLQGGASLGVIVAAAGMIRAFERHETSRVKAEASLARFAQDFLANLVALAICGLGLVLGAGRQELFVVICGLGIMALVVVARRLALGLWASMALSSLAIVIVLVLAVRNEGRGDLTLRFANAPASLVSDADRLISDTGWAGSGAGSFGALLPIYRDIDDPAGELAPTSAAQVSIEMGAPALWVIVIMMLALAGFLLRGAVRRGRDSFYPAAAMSASVVLTLEAFCDAGALSTATGLIAATTLGLGLAQSVSRNARQQAS
ncbi:MAG: hypothetical protein JO172_04470 [Hyphomicrobiales bacterium]|nr:hypothetical protein [Hyphomicrobiales bacterium]